MDWDFDHVHFLARDVHALSKYFAEVFGMELLSFEEDFKGAPYAIHKLGSGDLRIRGHREGDAPDAKGPSLVEGLDHLGLAADDVEKTVAWLESRGAEVLRPPEKTGVGGRTIAFIRGPGNIRIEICERVKGDRG